MWWWLACTDTSPSPDPIPPRALCTEPEGGRVGECPGDLRLPTADGGSFILQDHAGAVVVVHLAGATSEIDREISRFLDATATDAPQVVWVDVLTDLPAPSEADAIAWGADLALGYPVAYDVTGLEGERWGRTTQVPTVLVLDADGTVVGRMHDRTEDQLPGVLEDAVGG